MTTTKNTTWKFKNTKVAESLSILTVGDVHLGQTTTGTDWIIKSLYTLTEDPLVAQTTDFFFIEGDLFDHLLYLNNDALGRIQLWVIHLLRYCQRHKIALRVLEGTPGHDMRQSHIFEHLNNGFEIGCDLLYVTDLHYEVHAQTGVSILYLPDEHRTDCSVSYDMAKRLLAEHGVAKADFVLMHGAFDYQLPAIVKNTHSNKQWQDLVEHYIFVGHVHQFSQYGKILAAGSLERLCHGDEGPKGHLRVTISANKPDEIKFIENKKAKIYRTIDCRNRTVEDALDRIKTVVKRLPKKSYIRVLALKTDNIAVALDVLRVEFPDFWWKLEKESEKPTTETTDDMQVNLTETYTPIDLTKDNIPILIKERLIARGLSGAKLERALVLLEKSL